MTAKTDKVTESTATNAVFSGSVVVFGVVGVISSPVPSVVPSLVVDVISSPVLSVVPSESFFLSLQRVVIVYLN